MIVLNDFPTQEFDIDHFNCGADGSAVRVTHTQTGRQSSVAYFAPLTNGAEMRETQDRLFQELTEELRGAGIAPQPAPAIGGGIKKAGKPRWSDEKQHKRSETNG